MIGWLMALPWMAISLPPARAGEPKDGNRVVFRQDFEEWIWRPISYSMRQDGKRALAEGRALSYEHRGPLFRLPKGFGDLPAGRMMEGTEAYGGGRSMLLQTDRESELVVGLHGPYAHCLQPGKSYRYQVALKGRGKFYFRGWIDGVDPATGKTAWLGFPNLIAAAASDAWKIHSGVFQVPAYDRPPYKLGPRVSAAIVVERGSAVYVDEFEVRELDSRQGP